MTGRDKERGSLFRNPINSILTNSNQQQIRIIFLTNINYKLFIIFEYSLQSLACKEDSALYGS